MQNSRLQSSKLLGVAPDASLTDIKRAYRRIAKRLHPDRTGGDVASFRRITAAYNMLLQSHRDGASRRFHRPASKADQTQDKVKKRDRDTQNKRHQESTNASSARSGEAKADFGDFKFEWSSHFARAEKQRRAKKKAADRKRSSNNHESEAAREETFDPDDWSAWRARTDAVDAQDSSIHAQASADFSDASADGRDETVNKGFFNWFRKQKRHFKTSEPLKSGEDVKLRLKTTEQTLLFGGHHRIALQRLAACPSCQGISQRSCSICRDAGRVKVREEVTVYVPPGALSGTQIKVPRKGTAGLCGFEDGDLVLIIEHELPRGFRHDGNDLIGAFRIDRGLAKRGGIVELDVPRGKVKVRVPSKTKNGDRLRLKGQGLPCSTSNRVGDVYLELTVGRIA